MCVRQSSLRLRRSHEVLLQGLGSLRRKGESAEYMEKAIALEQSVEVVKYPSVRRSADTVLASRQQPWREAARMGACMIESTDIHRTGQVGRILGAQASASEKYRPVIATATEVVEW